MVENIPVPTYDEARRVIVAGDERVNSAKRATDPIVRETHYRNAFNTLFDSARVKVMAFLNTEETHWGELRDRLTDPFYDRFYEIVRQLHVAIFYHRTLPLVDIEVEYQRWRDRVLQLINDLEAQES